MDKVKPVTIGIIALLLLLLSFNFIPKTQKQNKTPQKINTESPQQTQSNATLAQSNAELIQKNIDFLKENLEALKASSAQEPLEQMCERESPKDTQTHLDSPTSLNETKTQDYQEESPTKNTQEQRKCQRTKPQLAIIIDDIGTLAQYRVLTKIHYKITPSLFPKSRINPQTPKIAEIAPFYMVHLPLEALNFYQEGHEWLFVGDSRDKIEKRIQAIKKDFPTLAYINNHTGSKFTQNLESMKLLLETLAKHNISFLDSRTTPHTKTNIFYNADSQKPLNPCQEKFLERDVFLDNELSIPKITQQLIQAVKIAKTKGYAIAIGHPHKETILALKNAEDYLTKSGVEIVYVNEIITP